MPMYTFKCNGCGEKAEYLVPTGSVPKECYECRSSDLERVFQGKSFSVPRSKRSGHREVLENSIVLGNIPCDCGGHWSVHVLMPGNPKDN